MSLLGEAPVRVNETVVRIIAAFVVTAAVGILYTQWIYLALYLAVDFFLRGFTGVKAPLAIIATTIAQAFKLKEKFIFAPPKRFAAQVGFAFSLNISILLLLGYGYAANVVTGILLTCAVLESVFGICVGCYFYNWFVAPLANRLSK